MNDRPPKLTIHDPAVRLTKREEQCARCIMAGKTNKEIKAELRISIWTVNKHVHRILRKFGVDRRDQIAILMVRRELAANRLGPEFVNAADTLIAELDQSLSSLRGLIATWRASKRQHRA